MTYTGNGQLSIEMPSPSLHKQHILYAFQKTSYPLNGGTRFLFYIYNQ